MRIFVHILVASALAAATATPSSAQECQSYRLVQKTVCEPQQVTTYRLQYETIMEEQTVTVQKPVWETEMRENRYRVAKPVVETAEREERYTVLKPVWETTYEDRSYTQVRYVTETAEREERVVVAKPVWETQYRDEQHVVRRPVTETVYQDQSYTTYQPVTTLRTQYVDQGACVQQWVYKPGDTRTRLRWLPPSDYCDPATGHVGATDARLALGAMKPVPGTYSVQQPVRSQHRRAADAADVVRAAGRDAEGAGRGDPLRR